MKDQRQINDSLRCTCLYLASFPGRAQVFGWTPLVCIYACWGLKYTRRRVPASRYIASGIRCYRLRTVSVLTAAFSGVQDLSPPFLLDFERGELLINFLWKVRYLGEKRCKERSHKIAQCQNVADLQHSDLKGLPLLLAVAIHKLLLATNSVLRHENLSPLLTQVCIRHTNYSSETTLVCMKAY